MSDQNFRAIKFLEYIKYKTVKRQIDPNVIEHLGFSGMGESDIYVSKDSDLVMPEGLTINFKLIRINWASTAFDADGKIINARKALYFEFSNGTNGLLKENWYKIFTRNGVEYRRYIFNSNFYKEQVQTNPNGVANWINIYDNQNYIESNDGGGDFPMSAVITINNDDANRGKFEQFMNMSYTDWSVYFNNKLQRFLLNGEAGLFDFYPTQVIVSHLSKGTAGNVDNSKLIQVLQKIGHGWGNNIGELSGGRRARILLDILSQIKPENAKDIYDEFFKTPSEIFYNSILNYLDDDDKVQFIFKLIKLFYAKMSKEDLIVYENKVKNLPKERILPFLSEEFDSHVQRGPYYEFEQNGNGLKIKNMTFWVYKPKTPNDTINIPRPVNPNDPNENMFSYIHNLQFGYDEIIGALACFDKPDQGFNQLMVYPIPAFAFPVFHNSLSKKYTLNDLLNELNTSACIIFPFFRIAQLENISYNIISLIFGSVGSILKDPVKNKIKETPIGLQFIYLYDILSNSWVAQDLSRTIGNGGIKAIIDCENLLASWSLYYNSQGYINMANAYPSEAETIKDYMKTVEISYEKAKKKWKK